MSVINTILKPFFFVQVLKLFKIRDYPMLLVGASHKYIYIILLDYMCINHIHVQLNY